MRAELDWLEMEMILSKSRASCLGASHTPAHKSRFPLKNLMNRQIRSRTVLALQNECWNSMNACGLSTSIYYLS